MEECEEKNDKRSCQEQQSHIWTTAEVEQQNPLFRKVFYSLVAERISIRVPYSVLNQFHSELILWMMFIGRLNNRHCIKKWFQRGTYSVQIHINCVLVLLVVSLTFGRNSPSYLNKARYPLPESRYKIHTAIAWRGQLHGTNAKLFYYQPQRVKSKIR